MFNKSKLGDGKQVVTVLGRNPETSDAISVRVCYVGWFYVEVWSCDRSRKLNFNFVGWCMLLKSLDFFSTKNSGGEDFDSGRFSPKP